MILKSSDAGVTWSEKNSGTSQDFSSIEFVSSSIGYAVGDDVFKTTDGGATWNPQRYWSDDGDGSAQWSSPLNSVQFTDAFHGWIFDVGGMLTRTVDGGQHWTTISPGDPQEMKSAKLLDAKYGWVVSSPNIVYRTTDGGSTWKSSTVNTEFGSADCVEFTDPLNGWISDCDASAMWKTTDGGQTWSRVDFSVNPYSEDQPLFVKFVNPTVGWVGTANDGLLRTSDAGATWQVVRADADITALEPVSGGPCVAVGDSGVILRSLDDGLTWSDRSGGASLGWLRGVSFVSASTGWVVGVQGVVLKTVDGGATWRVLPSGLSGMRLEEVHFADQLRGWASSSDGELVSTTDGGASWQVWEDPNLYSGESVRAASIQTASSDNLWGWHVSPWSVMRTTDVGRTWEKRLASDSGVFRKGAFVTSSSGWVVGQAGLIRRTTDGGVTWSDQSCGTDQELSAVGFFDTTTGWVAGEGACWKTVDGGATWIQQQIQPDPDRRTWINKIVPVSASRAWAFDSSGRVYQTNDGGASWRVDELENHAWLWDADFVDASNGWAVGSGGTIIKYSLKRATVCGLSSVSKSGVPYASSFAIKGTVREGLQGFAGGRVVLQSSMNGADFVNAGTTTTATDGSFTFTPIARSKTWYRVVFKSDATRNGSTSKVISVLPKVSLGVPHAPASMSKNRPYTVYGDLKPAHELGSYVRIYKWKKTSSGSWKSYGYVTANARHYSSYLRYSASLQLAYSGTWRLRAYLPADSDHYASWSSSYDYITVK